MTKFNENYLIPCLLRPIESLTGPTEKFSLKKGVPEMKQADFLKGIMQIFGLFAYLKDEQTIGFMSFKDLYDSDNFYDWTDKVITTSNSFDTPETIEFKLDGFAQTNTFNYTGDSDAEQSNEYKGNLYVNNSTIEKTKESVKSPFNYSKSSNNIIKIGVYVTQDKKNVDSVNDNLKPRILKEGTNYSAIFPDELKWSNILKNENYTAYQQAILLPRVLKIKCLLTDWDLAHINFAFPVYFRQYGHFYAIIKIQTKAGGVCDCSFLQIK